MAQEQSPEDHPGAFGYAVLALLDEVERLSKAHYDEAFQHALCLGIAEGAPGWRNVMPERAAGHAVKALREEVERLRSFLERTKT